MNIQESTRQMIIDELLMIGCVTGQMGVAEFVRKVYPKANNLPTTDYRFGMTTAIDDIRQHMDRNNDWGFEELFYSYLDFLKIDDEDFKYFLAQYVHPSIQLSAREKLEYCHRMIDCYAENLTPYIYTQQVLGLDNLAKKLAVESVCSTVNAAIHCGELAEVLKMGMELGDTDDVGDLYGDDEDPVCDEYMERDKQVLLYMKKHPEIRKIVEEQIGKPITSIWKDAEA